MNQDKITDCVFFLTQKCTKDNCKFRHFEPAKSQLTCRNWFLKDDCKNEKCQFRHPSKTTQECSYFSKGNCTNGFKCPYVHLAPEEKKQIDKKVENQVEKPKVNQLFLKKSDPKPNLEKKEISPEKKENQKKISTEKDPLPENKEIPPENKSTNNQEDSPEKKGIKRPQENETSNPQKKSNISNEDLIKELTEFGKKLLDLDMYLNSSE